MTLACLTFAPEILSAQEILRDPEHFWNHKSKYAGSAACQGCHADIYKRQQSSNHALSLRPAEEVDKLLSRVPLEKVDRVANATLRLALAGSELELSAHKEGNQSTATLEWAFGSGLKGITPVGRMMSGEFVESRLTWYKSLQDIDFTTGASRHDPRTVEESLGRPLTRKQVAECFGCHTTGYDRQKQAPARNEMGVRCERCHGPGLEHANAAAAGETAATKIANPGRLGAFAQIQMCGACHGKPPRDNEFDGLRLIEQTPHSVRFPSQRLVLSRCYNESLGDLTCTTCHDPHEDVSAVSEEHDTRCLSCHQESSHQASSTCPVEDKNCASCHMPKERVMRHSLFSDHWIRVVR